MAGPLPGGAIEDRAAVSWTSTGWTNGRNVERMLDTLWKQGVVTVAGRDGLAGERLVGRGVRRREFGHVLRRDDPRRILSTGESAGRSRRAQAR
jgi:hypothetical protein